MIELKLKNRPRPKRSRRSAQSAMLIEQIAALGSLGLCLSLRAASFAVVAGANHHGLIEQGLDSAETAGERGLADAFARAAE